MNMRATSSKIAAALAALLACAAPGLAQQAAPGRIALELNKLEPAGPACRAYLALRSGLAARLETLTLDLVLFDGDGVVLRRVAVEAGPLRAGKVAVRAFDMAELNCAALGRVLLNGVLACRDADGARKGCLDLIDVSSRAAAPLID